MSRAIAPFMLAAILLSTTACGTTTPPPTPSDPSASSTATPPAAASVAPAPDLARVVDAIPPQIKSDLRLMLGGHFSADHLGPGAVAEVDARCRAGATAYLDAYESMLTCEWFVWDLPLPSPPSCATAADRARGDALLRKSDVEARSALRRRIAGAISPDERERLTRILAALDRQAPPSAGDPAPQSAPRSTIDPDVRRLVGDITNGHEGRAQDWDADPTLLATFERMRRDPAPYVAAVDELFTAPCLDVDAVATFMPAALLDRLAPAAPAAVAATAARIADRYDARLRFPVDSERGPWIEQERERLRKLAARR